MINLSQLIGTIVLLLWSFLSFAQQDSLSNDARVGLGKLYIGFEYSPAGHTLNQSQLVYDPFGEYGRSYEYSVDYKLDVGYLMASRLYSGVVLGYEEHHYSSYSINPFLSGEEGEFLSSEGNIIQTVIGVGAEIRYNFIEQKKIRAYVNGQFSFQKAKKNSTERKSYYSSSLGNQVISEPEETDEIEEVHFSKQEISLGAEYRLIKSLFLTGEVRFTYGYIHVPFSRDFSTSGPFLIERKEIKPAVGLRWYL